MRVKVVLAMIVMIALVAVSAYWELNRAPAAAQPGTLELTNLPDTYCPTEAEIVVEGLSTKETLPTSDQKSPITNCRTISLESLGTINPQPTFLLIKLPKALAFRLQIDSLKGSYQYSPSLGDVNNDNVIDLLDRQQVESAIFSSESTAVKRNDIDQDNKVTVLDLALTRVNSRAGATRPDGRDWGVL